MAEDWLQKSVQGVSDPTARKKAYYSRQRENAEENQDYGTLDKIKGKQGKGPAERMPKNATQDQWENAFNTAVGFTPLGRAARVARGAEEAASLVPQAEEAGAGLAKKTGQFLGRAKPVAKGIEKRKELTQAREALPNAERKAIRGAEKPKALPKPKARAVSKVEKGTGNTKMGKQLPKGKVNPKANKGRVTDRGDSAHMSNKYYKRMQESTEKLNKMDEVKPKKKIFGR